MNIYETNTRARITQSNNNRIIVCDWLFAADERVRRTGMRAIIIIHILFKHSNTDAQTPGENENAPRGYSEISSQLTLHTCDDDDDVVWHTHTHTLTKR